MRRLISFGVVALGYATAAPSLPLTAQAADLDAQIMRCEGCHGAHGRAEVMPSAGRIAGQNEAYLIYILKQYRSGRLGGVNAAIMTYAVKQLTDQQIGALAHYYAGLHAGRP